jgi:hypothetical protein
LLRRVSSNRPRAAIALVADGLHMSTHASALLLPALAYRYARRHADDARFSFGTGKLGDLAGFAGAHRAGHDRRADRLRGAYALCLANRL